MVRGWCLDIRLRLKVFITFQLKLMTRYIYIKTNTLPFPSTTKTIYSLGRALCHFHFHFHMEKFTATEQAASSWNKHYFCEANFRCQGQWHSVLSVFEYFECFFVAFLNVYCRICLEQFNYFGFLGILLDVFVIVKYFFL